MVQRPGIAGHVSNNWVPVAAIGVLFLGGAVAAVVVDGDTGRIAAYFVVSTLVLVLVTAPWLIRHPPAISARTGAYLVLAVGVELGALLGGAVAAFHGLGAWVVLGIGLAMYGLLERGRVMVTAGVATAVLGLASIVADRAWLTLVLALLGTAGRVVVPIAVQQTLDRGINAPGGIDYGFVSLMAALAAGAIVVTGVSSYFMTARLFTAAERRRLEELA